MKTPHVEHVSDIPKDSIYLLGISGSPRNQATDYVLTEAVKEIQGSDVVTETVFLRQKTISPCIHCGQCDHGRLYTKQGKYCSIDDDMQALYDKFRRADAILLASPVYGGGISGQLKCVLDRMRALAHAAPTELRGANKVGGAITVAGSRHGGQQLTAQDLFRWFLWYGIMPVPATTWECLAAGTIWSRFQGSVTAGQGSHASGRKGASQDALGLDAARSVAKNLILKARVLKAGSLALGLRPGAP
jgi:multimeric flavodoxin WrbA